VPIGQPKSITACRNFFTRPASPKQRLYEALRAFYVEHRPSHEAAKAFGYTTGSFRVLCHQFRRDPEPQFFASLPRGPRAQPQKSQARQRIIELRKRNHSIYEISATLREAGLRLSPTAVREVLIEEGFAALPRRLDEERPSAIEPSTEPVADVRSFALTERTFATACGGLFLFVPELVRLDVDALAANARLPGSAMIPAGHALRCALALKLWSIQRKSHIMALVADEGLGLFAGLNAIPKKSYLSEYSCRVGPQHTTKLLAAWHRQVDGDQLFDESSFNLDFHSLPYYGEQPVVEKHFVSMRSRRQPSILTFMAQDAEGRAFCYSNANLRKGEQAEEVLRFVEFWHDTHGERPRHLVFDSQLTTYANYGRLDDMSIPFITLRRRSPKILAEIDNLPPSAWRKVELDVATRKFRTPRVYEQRVTLEKHSYRQLYILDLGHEEPTVLLTNDRRATAKQLITRYAQRMLIENALSDAVRFFHMDALSSAVGLKVDFDLALLVVASGLYRLLARKMRGYVDAQARQIFRDLIDMPADLAVAKDEVRVRFHRRAHLPIIVASGLLEQTTKVPWWNGAILRLSV
jgi:hypothetical protein